MQRNGFLKKTLGFVFIFVTLTLGNAAAKHDFLIETQLSKTQLILGEKLQVTVTVTWPSQFESASIREITPPENSRLKLLHASQSSASRYQEGKTVSQTEYRYLYECSGKGNETLAPFVLEWESETGMVQMEKGEEVTFQIISPLKKFVFWILWIFLGAMVIAGVFFLISRWKNKTVLIETEQKQEAQSVSIQRFQSEFLDDLRKLRKMWIEGNYSHYFSRMNQLLFTYLSKRYGKDLFQEKIQKDWRNHEGRDWEEILKGLDYQKEQVAFAGVVPEEKDRERLLRMIEKKMLA